MAYNSKNYTRLYQIWSKYINFPKSGNTESKRIDFLFNLDPLVSSTSQRFHVKNSESFMIAYKFLAVGSLIP